MMDPNLYKQDIKNKQKNKKHNDTSTSTSVIGLGQPTTCHAKERECYPTISTPTPKTTSFAFYLHNEIREVRKCQPPILVPTTTSAKCQVPSAKCQVPSARCQVPSANANANTNANANINANANAKLVILENACKIWFFTKPQHWAKYPITGANCEVSQHGESAPPHSKQCACGSSVYCTAQDNRKQNSTVQHSTVQCSTVQYSTVQYSAVQYSAVQSSPVQSSPVQYSTVQYSTVQSSPVQYSTVQYSPVQYSTRVPIRT